MLKLYKPPANKTNRGKKNNIESGRGELAEISTTLKDLKNPGFYHLSIKLTHLVQEKNQMKPGR